MTHESGYTVVELLVATAVMVTATGAILGLLESGTSKNVLWNEAADLHQRARVAAARLAAELGAAGAGTNAGPLPRSFAALAPGRRSAGTADASAVTLRYVPEHAPRSTLSAPLVPSSGIASIASDSGCPQAAVACGFRADMDAVIFNNTGNWDTVVIQSIDPGVLVIGDRPAPRSVTYNAGAQIVQIVEVTLYLDPAGRVLRREHPGASDLPLVDNVVDLAFEYFGDPLPPTFPRPPAGTGNCLYDIAGTPIPLPVLTADHGALASLPISMLTDGPFCGAGSTTYDLDLLRIRKVRASVTLQTGQDSLRSADPRLFARPGTATGGDRLLPDVRLSIEVAPRNFQR